jgi:hypothetical protein
MRNVVCSLVAGACLLSGSAVHTQSKPAANTHPLYKELRAVAVAAEAYQVTDFALTKDAATFTLTGSLHMLAPVQGKVTGAVFLGRGTMTYTPPIAAERSMLRNLTRGEEFAETFEKAVFRFTDDTAARIKAAATGNASGSTSQAQDALKDLNETLRLRLRDNLHARILHDVLSPASGGLFHAYINGKKYSNKLVYIVDPQGAGFVAPEEVQLFSWADNKEGIFAGHYLSPSYRSPQRRPSLPGTWIDIEHQLLKTAIEPNGELTGDATTTFVSMLDGLSAVPLSLFPTLRVSSVTTADGAPLSFIQESKEEDADFWVVLPKPLAKGEKLTIHTLYKGKDAVSAEGADNFFPVARDNWYPNGLGFKDYATYDMTFSVHKRMQLVATGDFVAEAVEGDRTVSKWKAEYPLSVAGFNLGLFKRDEGKALDYTVVALANKTSSDSTTELRQLAQQFNLPMGSLDTTSANKMALTEAQLALQLFTDYFGPISLKRVHMTQQTACNFGQAWPGVIYIPTCYYWAPVVRQQIGMQQGNAGYWDSVASHEVAHLWWGHALGWNSYRDQWMSEGFASLSASLFLQAAYPKEPHRFRDFWKENLKHLTEKNVQGFRPIDVGPVTQGYRLSSGRTGAITSSLIYPKGAYILHMLRMMMWNRDQGDAKFKTMMQDFIKSHRNQPISTEDFKDIVEKHMLPEMDLDGDKKMNWFFRQYVYGTELPTYKLQQSVANKNGQVVLNVKVTQSNVSDGFKMLVPLYIELQDGRVMRLGSARMTGNTTIDQEIPVGQIPVKRVLLNHNYDVLALEEK